MKSVKKIGGLFRHKGKEEKTKQETEDATETPAAEPEMSTSQQEQEKTGEQSQETQEKSVKIYIVFYSMYGHVYQLAQAIKRGIDSVEGCSGILYQVAETLPDEVLEKMHAPAKPEVPVIAAKDLAEADGLVFGFPTRFGMMCTQMKTLFDATGGLWQSGGLVGKPASLFTSTGTQGGGQETTMMTALTQLVHHGMIFVPPGYTLGSTLFDVGEIRGGGPWGAGTYAGADGSRQPSGAELTAAEHQGSYFASKAKLLVN